jgi:hypothetical protein
MRDNLILVIQTQSWDEVRYRHTLDAALTIWRTEGPSAFYRGLLPSLLGILHVAVQFPLYEQLKILARELLSLAQRNSISAFLQKGTRPNLSPLGPSSCVLLCRRWWLPSLRIHMKSFEHAFKCRNYPSSRTCHQTGWSDNMVEGGWYLRLKG